MHWQVFIENRAEILVFQMCFRLHALFVQVARPFRELDDDAA